MLTLFTDNVEAWFFAFAHFHCAVMGNIMHMHFCTGMNIRN